MKKKLQQTGKTTTTKEIMWCLNLQKGVANQLNPIRDGEFDTNLGTIWHPFGSSKILPRMGMAYVDCPELSSVFGCDVVVHAAQVRSGGAPHRWCRCRLDFGLDDLGDLSGRSLHGRDRGWAKVWGLEVDFCVDLLYEEPIYIYIISIKET